MTYPIQLSDVQLTQKEAQALLVITNEGLDCTGGEKPSDLLDNNMSWFAASCLMKALKINKNEAAGIMSALDAKCIAMDNDPGAKERYTWALTDYGINMAQELFDALDAEEK